MTELDVRRARPTASTNPAPGDLSRAEERGTRRSSAATVDRRAWGGGRPLNENELFAAYDVDPRRAR